MVAVSEILMFIYAVGAVLFLGVFSFLMDYLYPQIVVKKISKPVVDNYNGITMNDNYDVILDDDITNDQEKI